MEDNRWRSQEMEDNRKTMIVCKRESVSFFFSQILSVSGTKFLKLQDSLRLSSDFWKI